MNFDYTDEQKQFAESVRRFAQDHLASGALKRAHDPRFPYDVVQFGNFGPIRVFAEYGTAAQKKRWLGELLAGRMVMSLGMTEPDAGSAVTDLKTSARPDGSHYIINGSKVFSTFSPDAQIFLIYVRFGPGLGGIGSVLIERGAPGFTIAAPSEFMSGEEWGELHFADC